MFLGMIDNNINSAIVSGQLGLQRASDGITNASVNIAQKSAQSTLETDGVGTVLANASVNGLSTLKQTLPSATDSFTSDLLSLQINSLNAQASAKVLDTAYDAVGTIIDTLA